MVSTEGEFTVDIRTNDYVLNGIGPILTKDHMYFFKKKELRTSFIDAKTKLGEYVFIPSPSELIRNVLSSFVPFIIPNCEKSTFPTYFIQIWMLFFDVAYHQMIIRLASLARKKNVEQAQKAWKNDLDIMEKQKGYVYYLLGLTQISQHRLG